MDATENLGLLRFGPNGWRGDGTDHLHSDFNANVVESVVTAVQANITEITNSITEVKTSIKNIVIAGGGDASFVFTQNVASATWTVQHNLGKFPAVTVVDSSGHEVVGDINHNSPNSLSIFFSAPFAGNAYLN